MRSDSARGGMMGRLELRIPLTEVVVVEEDLRQGLMRIIVEGEEYPKWSVGYEAMAMRIDRGASLIEMGNWMLKILEGIGQEDAKGLRSARPDRLIRNSEDLAEGEEAKKEA